ncbi:hypothetical protein STSU_000845 [Streptomyces tsukubensis NRRL18488]|uniref:Uncharacterized protein n=1 Tax=Streptomyces tsukubensis (strain DSM 42081 / NBRC 108919 / NRRL 18488 / 9993) TaxID=1114943 RepID=A0A7G3U6B9_STRT9|nr:hypothetical protein STSU_000845 [Streptomyces tsukubensis NRRL18488]
MVFRVWGCGLFVMSFVSSFLGVFVFSCCGLGWVCAGTGFGARGSAGAGAGVGVGVGVGWGVVWGVGG